MKFRILFWIVSSLIPGLSGQSQDLTATIGLAEGHFNSGQVTEALYTYQRAAFFADKQADSDLLFRIAECFRIEGEFEQAIEYYDHAFFAESSDKTRNEITFRKANSFIETNNYNFALIELMGMRVDEGSFLDRRRSLYLGSAYYGLEDFKNAKKYFLKAIPDSEQELKEQVSQIFEKKGNFYRPNPKLAFWLSVFLPGTGQFYAGDWVSGVNSFLLTGSLLSLTFYLTKIYNPLDAILTVLPWFQRYYQGGFDQAERIAEIRRKNKRNQAYQSIANIIQQANYPEK